MYYCGNQLKPITEKKTINATVLLIDYDESAYGTIYADGTIQTHWHMHSSVPHKHGKGGQSKQRFQRIRENEITIWFKRINQALQQDQQNFILGINPVYQKRFTKTLNQPTKERIKQTTSIEYSGITGLHQIRNKLHVNKHNRQAQNPPQY